MDASDACSAKIVDEIPSWSIVIICSVLQVTTKGQGARGRNSECASQPFCQQWMLIEVCRQRILADLFGSVLILVPQCHNAICTVVERTCGLKAFCDCGDNVCRNECYRLYVADIL